MAFKMKNTAYYKKKMAESERASSHIMHSHLKEYIPQSQRKMDQYIPQTEMAWNDPNRPEFRVSSKDYEESSADTSGSSSAGELLANADGGGGAVNTGGSLPTWQDLPSASSNRPKTTISTPTEIDTSDIDAYWARKNARREHRQAARRDRREERQAARQSRRDARQKRRMDRIENRTERQEARRDRRDQRKFDRRYRKAHRRGWLPSFGGRRRDWY